MGKAHPINLVVVSLLIFSIWVAFALLVINPYLHPYIPGYRVGNPCGWELVALAVSTASAYFWTREWPKPKRQTEKNIDYLKIDYNFILFLVAYLFTAIVIFIWQYHRFSTNYGQ